MVAIIEENTLRSNSASRVTAAARHSSRMQSEVDMEAFDRPFEYDVPMPNMAVQPGFKSTGAGAHLPASDGDLKRARTSPYHASALEVQVAELQAALSSERAKRRALEADNAVAKERAERLYQERQSYKSRLREAYAAFMNLKESYLRLRATNNGGENAEQPQEHAAQMVCPGGTTATRPRVQVTDTALPDSEPNLAGGLHRDLVPPTEGEELWLRHNFFINKQAEPASNGGVPDGPNPHDQDQPPPNVHMGSITGAPTVARELHRQRDAGAKQNSSEVAQPPVAMLPTGPSMPTVGDQLQSAGAEPAAAPVVRSPQWRSAVRGNTFSDDFDCVQVQQPIRHPPILSPRRSGPVPAGASSVAVEGGRPPRPHGATGPRDIKCQEVVRLKDARSRMPAFECAECQRFYAALERSGSFEAAMAAGVTLRRCGHEDSRGAGTTVVRAEVVANAGKHRYHHEPPLTPAGFWDIAFSPAEAVTEVRHQAAGADETTVA